MLALRRPTAVLLLVWYLPACATGSAWTSRPVAPQAAKRTMYVGDLRVGTEDGETHRFRGVWMSQDSLGGWLAEPAGVERTFPLSEVATLEQWRSGSHRAGTGHGMSGGAWGFLIGATLGAAVGGAAGAGLCWEACSGAPIGAALVGALVWGALGLLIGSGDPTKSQWP